MTATELGQKIAELRKRKGITQEELAAKASINVRTIQRIEKGEVDPRSYTINEIARVLEVDPGELLEHKSNDSRLWILLLHLTNYVPVLIPAVFLYVWKKDESPEIREHGIYVLNFQISMFIYLMIAGFLSLIAIGFIIALILGILTWIFTSVNIAKFLGGHNIRYPLSMKIIN
jgi:transcriptional regulator with XRE-family HTH domain